MRRATYSEYVTCLCIQLAIFLLLALVRYILTQFLVSRYISNQPKYVSKGFMQCKGGLYSKLARCQTRPRSR